jgi:hypothetical protein
VCKALASCEHCLALYLTPSPIAPVHSLAPCSDIAEVFRILGYIFSPISLIIELLLSVIDCAPNEEGDLVDCIIGEIDLPFPDFTELLKSFGFDLEDFILNIVGKLIKEIKINVSGAVSLGQETGRHARLLLLTACVVSDVCLRRRCQTCHSRGRASLTSGWLR